MGVAGIYHLLWPVEAGAESPVFLELSAIHFYPTLNGEPTVTPALDSADIATAPTLDGSVTTN